MGLLNYGVNITKSCKYGMMVYNPKDIWVGRSLTEYGEYSEAEVDLFKQVVKPGDFVLEAGANIGALTLPLAKLVGPSGAVIAFEPQRMMHNLLVSNITLNSLRHVYTFPEAIGNAMGSIDIPEWDYTKEGNFGGFRLDQKTEGVETYRVKIKSIDDLRLKKLDFLKVDVEGMEIDVIAGAKKTISEFRPILYLEDDRADKSPELHKLVKSLGYKIYYHKPLLFNDKNYENNRINVFGQVKSLNILCLPEELALPEGVSYGLSQKEKPITEHVGRFPKLKEAVEIPEYKPEEEKKVVEKGEQMDLLKQLLQFARLSCDNLDFDKAYSTFKYALKLQPDNWLFRYEYSKALAKCEDYFLAITHLEHAIKFCEDDMMKTVLWHKLATCYAGQGNLDKAIECDNESLKITRGSVLSLYSLSHYYLSTGNLENGFELFESRFGLTKVKERIARYSKPKWNGEDLNGKRVLLINEQGAGDLIFYSRWFPWVKEQGAHVIAEVSASHIEIMKKCAGVDEIFMSLEVEANDDYDYWVSVASLPYWAGVELEDIPQISFSFEPKDVDIEALETDDLKIGVAWAGNPNHPKDHNRSFNKEFFRDIDALPNVQLFSLQKRDGGKRYHPWKGLIDLSTNCERMEVVDLAEHLENSQDTVNIIDKLDLVITADTFVAHLAGAMNKPVWLLMPELGDWRWDIDNWYSSVKIYRSRYGISNDHCLKKTITKDVKELYENISS